MVMNYGTNENWRWIGDTEVVEFAVEDDGKPITCRVSRGYIEDHCGNPPGTPESLLTAAKANFDEITDNVGALIAAGLFEKDGSILLRSGYSLGRSVLPSVTMQARGGPDLSGGQAHLVLPSVTMQARGDVSNPTSTHVEAEEVSTEASVQEEEGEQEEEAQGQGERRTRLISNKDAEIVIAQAKSARETTRALLQFLADQRLNTPEASEAQAQLERQIEQLDAVVGHLDIGNTAAAEQTYRELLAGALRSFLKALQDQSAMKGIIAATTLTIMNVGGVDIHPVSQAMVTGAIVGPGVLSEIRKLWKSVKGDDE